MVCQESMAEKELGSVCMLPCRHMFHRACLSEWLGRAGSCPTCVELIKYHALPEIRPFHSSLSRDLLLLLQRSVSFQRDVALGGVQVPAAPDPAATAATEGGWSHRRHARS